LKENVKMNLIQFWGEAHIFFKVFVAIGLFTIIFTIITSIIKQLKEKQENPNEKQKI